MLERDGCMRNKFWIRMVALVLVLSLVGCGTPTSQQNNAKESTNVTANQEDVDKSTTVQSEETIDDDINVDTETNEETTTEKETETEISEEKLLNEKEKILFPCCIIWLLQRKILEFLKIIS